ncbi:hypothetical protein M2396_004072 [Pseudomonas sp. BIGb0278]|uniref:hypothetical protein n=1 Tax=Pseudomonas TaxID=286 RepID=UPI001373781B|nr:MULTISPECIES: hypothetical protein [Pseudomonas]MCS4285768.1 hypothetical protein [Pseudomonas sp. BIGb0278]MEE4652422.1 hypothetical protein [Pseudomonas alliivorans]
MGKFESIERGGWDKYQRQRAFGLVSRFMKKDTEGASHWFDMDDGYGLDCLVLGDAED